MTLSVLFLVFTLCFNTKHTTHGNKEDSFTRSVNRSLNVELHVIC